MNNRGWWILLFVVLLSPPGYMAWTQLRRETPALSIRKPAAIPALTTHGEIPSFELTDQDGRAFSRARLNGKIWIADFVFTSCAGTCPQMTQKMAGLQATLPAEIELVSFSVDPARDTPAILKRYGKQWGADFTRWHFLTGPEKEIGRLTKDGFRLSYAEGTDPDEPVIHSVRFVLIDKAGAIRGYYDSSETALMNQLVTDASSLLAAHD